ncbi:MAG: BMC domain-containing protein [Nocardioidaceae bacterium]|nr:MAG: BMC domain-containing protein [Nocardioidaceae bacterium]
MATGSKFDLRALLQIDRLQPQFAAYTGAVIQGAVPLAGDTLLIGEMGPGNEVFRAVDVALKAADVQATSQVVEREFGFFVLRSPVNAEITAAREALLSYLNLSIEDRRAPTVESRQVITSVEPYQAQLLNKRKAGSLLVPGSTLGIVECAPAAYVMAAANEAEKAASISFLDVNSVGRFGRLFMSGSEADVRAAVDTAVEALGEFEGRK